jgi:hypothetical protein
MLGKPIFWFRWPTYDILRGDLKRARIERIDALGRTVHFHSFRKTWQTLGVRYGIKANVTTARISHLRKILRTRDRAQLVRDLSHAPVWMHPFIRHIADGGETP